MPVSNHLPGSSARASKAKTEHNVIQTPLKQLEKDFPRHPATPLRLAEVAAELALQNTVLVPQFLFLS
jgi:hypothetical protein